MAYQLNDINFRTVSDPVAFMAESDETYRRKVAEAADRIIQNQSRSPIVLLSGPSGSGKTTTSMKIAEELNRRGVGTHYVATISRQLTRIPPARRRASWIWSRPCAWIWTC